MAIKFFGMYIGSLLALSIVLFVLAKQFAQGFETSGRKAIVYGTFSSVIASISFYLSSLIREQLFLVYWIFSLVFLLFGIIHMAIVHKKYFTSSSESLSKLIIAETFFALSVVFFTIIIFSSLQYFMQDKGKDFLFYPMMTSCIAFFIPMLVYYTFETAYSIPAPVYTTWLYPLNSPIELPPDNPKERLLVIAFELEKKTTDLKRTFFRAKTPENIELGELYYHFINDYNELHSDTPIEYTNLDYEACEWIFFRKKRWFQSKEMLDPFLSMRDNNIIENTVIICERVT